MITQDRLRQLLSYDPETGIFRRKQGGRGVKTGSVAGSAGPRGQYLVIRIDGRNHYAHRLAWLYVHGEWPASKLDHRNRISTDNRIENLRLATDLQSAANRKNFKNNTTGFRGATFNKVKQKYQARVGRKSFGYFETAEEAGAAARAARLRLFGDFAPETSSQL